MSFWETFGDACDVANEAMGETIIVDGNEVVGVVSGIVSVEDGMAPGGRKFMVSGEIVVPGSVTPRDGMPVVVRGLDSRVDSWERLGAGEDDCWLLRLDSPNGWSGEIPGA